MKLETIILEKRDSVAAVTLNRPQALNALNSLMMRELIETFGDIAKDDDARAVVITGAGKAFCAGADVKEMGAPEGPMDTYEMMRRVHKLILGIRSLEKPVIAAVNGYAVGLGCGIALACDIRIASENAIFGERFVRVGLMPGDGDTYLLPLLVGLGRASEFLFTGDDIDAKKAEQMGLVNRVVPPDQLKAVVWELASRLSKGASKAIAATKATMNRFILPALRADLEYSIYAQSRLFETEDHREALRAFREKRKPEFKGR